MSNTDYDIVEAFEKIENELIKSMIGNLDHHRAMETDEGFEWSQWQVEQLKAVERYKAHNAKKYGTTFKDINEKIDVLIKMARSQGQMDQEIQILKAIKKGKFDYHKPSKREVANTAAFFRVNDKKVDALIEATKKDFEKAEHAMLRRADDQYRKVIFNAQMYAAAGGTTYEKAVDMALESFLRAGLNCIEYKNGSRHTMKDYADMCIKTATKRAYLTGEGEKRKEWGYSLVIMNKRTSACPKCMPFAGKVLVDDVWSGGEPDGKHMLMSTAIEHGLYHPRCRDVHTTYFPGISTAEDESPLLPKEKKKLVEDYNREQKQQYCKRQAEQQARMAEMMLDAENREMHKTRAEQWRTKELDNMSMDELRTLAKEEAIKYYSSGKSKISFGDRTPEEVAETLVQNGSKTSLIKDIKSLKKKNREILEKQKVQLDNSVESSTIKLSVGSSSGYGKSYRYELGQIDIENTELAIDAFSEQIRDSDIENSIVIDKAGNVVHFKSIEQNSVVMYDIDFKDAIVLHNHPEINGIVSFGQDDFVFLRDHQNVKSLRCCNSKYDYSVKVLKDISDISYNDLWVEAMRTFEQYDEDDMQHIVFEILNKKGYVEYERNSVKRS